MMKRMLALFAFLPLAALAQAPGEYVTEGGWGTLVVGPAKGGANPFKIDALGSNFHVCGLEGEIRGGKATLEGEEPKKPCIVTFKSTPTGLEVKGTEGACGQYCGMRAQFEGTYLKPAKGCAASEMKATRAAFKRQYDARKFDEARALLEPLHAGCGKMLFWIDEGWVRNDLAITQYRLGDRAGCLKTLQPLSEDAAKTDAQLKDDYPPSDWDAYSRVVRATRANLKLCKSAAK